MINLIKLLLSIFQGISYKKFGKMSYIKYPNYINNKKNIEIGENVSIEKYSFIFLINKHNKNTYNPILKIGNNVVIGQNLTISCMGNITIENSVLMSRNIFIGDGIHGYQDINIPIIEQDMLFKGNILIKEGAFIGINSVILPGVTIGKNAVIGANSTVTKDIPDYAIVAGSPAKIIKYYDKIKNNYIKI